METAPSETRLIRSKPRPDPRVVTEPQPSATSGPPSTENPDADARVEPPPDGRRRVAPPG